MGVLRILMVMMGVFLMANIVRGQEVQAQNVQEIVTPKGITAWLIEARGLPMVSIELNFRAGAVYEPAGQEGLSDFTAALLDEGAADLNAKDFKEELEAIGARFGAGADGQDVSVNLTTLSEHKERAFALLKMAVRQPRFDKDAVERVRDAILANIERGDEDPSVVAWRLFRPAIYGDHPYANSGEGTLKSVGGLDATDAAAWHRAQFTKANMVVAVVGDVGAKELAALLDGALGDLPAGKVRNEITVGPKAPAAGVEVAQMDVPQGTILLGHLGMPRSDPDFYAMLVMNEILGGGVLTSRLGADVREKHGLVYGINSVNVPLPYNGMFYVSLATDNNKVEKALGLVRKHLTGIAAEPVTQEEFDDAKAYLIGSFPLRLDSNGKLLNMLALMQSEGLGPDYMAEWPKRIAKVTREDVQRVAQKLIKPEAMRLVVVGDGAALKVQ